SMPIYPITCGNCGEKVAASIAGTNPLGGLPYWLICPVCADGSVVVKSGAVYPAAPAGGRVKNLPADVEQAWREARTAHAVAAYTAAEIMCRKILMHLAVGVASAKAGESFAVYIDALDKAGYISTGLKPTVDMIRQR